MSSINVFQVAKDSFGPPGLTHPLLVENYAWVDKRLHEMYYDYVITSSECDEYDAEGFLNENYAWIDAKLDEMCHPSNSPSPSHSPSPSPLHSPSDLNCIEEDIFLFESSRCEYTEFPHHVTDDEEEAPFPDFQLPIFYAVSDYSDDDELIVSDF